MFRSRMRCDSKTKCKMVKIHNKMIDNSAPFLDQLFWQYLCFAKHFFFYLLSIWGCSGDNMIDDIIFHKLNLLLAHHHSISILEKFCNYSNEWPKTSPWYSHLLSGLYHIGNSGCMGFDRVRTTSLGRNRCW